MSEIDYLLIGHLCKDLTSNGPRLGGTASFCALTARALGLRPGILTSIAIKDDITRDLMRPLKGLPIHIVPAYRTTTFENVYRDGVRTQTLHGRADLLTPEHVPPGWEQVRIVHLAPVAQEVSYDFIGHFTGASVTATPQGWMRQWDTGGRVSFTEWPDANAVLPQLAAVVLSEEDVEGVRARIDRLARHAKLLIVTRGQKGSVLYRQGQRHHIPAPDVHELDPTGAGDIYASAFFYRLMNTGDPLEAARFATALASASVSRIGLDSIPVPTEIARALSA